MKRFLAVLFLSLCTMAMAAPLVQDPEPNCNPCTPPKPPVR